MLAQPTQQLRSGGSPPATARAELSGLGNRFLGLLGRRWSRRSFATEVAKLLVETTRVKAVAVLAYERQRDRLVLLADCGLSTEARLTLGGAADAGWDLPACGLKRRRISVVEAAHQNPLIPDSVRSLSADGLCVVSLPLYYDAVPVGAVVLFAARGRAFSDAQLQTLSQALRVCGRGLREREPASVRAPGADGEVGGGQAPQWSEAIPAAGMAESGAMAGAAAAARPARLGVVDGEPAGAGGLGFADARSTAAPPVGPDLGQAQPELQRRNEALRNLMHAGRAVRAERDRLRQQLGDLEALRAHETGELHGQLGLLEDRLLAVESERQRAQRAADAQRRAADDVLQALRSERERWHAQQALEAAQRLQQAEEVAALQAQLAAQATEQQCLLEELALLRADKAAGDQSWAAAAAREAAIAREADELREQLRQRDATLQATAADRERLQRAQEAAAVAAAAEIEELRGAVHEAVRRLEQERLARAAELDALLQEAAPAESAAALPFLPGGDAPDDASVAPAIDEALTIERSAPLAPLADMVTDAAEPLLPIVATSPAASLGELVVLDDGALADQACAALAAAGFEVAAQPLGEATVDDLARRKLKCVMLNLGAGAAAWRTLRMLREHAGTRNVPVLAYVMTAQLPTGFCLGRVDFALSPLEPGRLIERLGRLRPQLQRLLIVSADVEGMGALREPLSRAKISTSIVLDAKQALEFASMVEADAAIVHLAPTCPSAAGAIAGLRANESTRDLPILVLLDGDGIMHEQQFFVGVGRQLLGRAGFQFSKLPEEIGRLVG